jgi:hypothetical protein
LPGSICEGGVGAALLLSTGCGRPSVSRSPISENQFAVEASGTSAEHHSEAPTGILIRSAESGGRLKFRARAKSSITDAVCRLPAVGDGHANSADGSRDDKDACKRNPHDGDDANAAEPARGSLCPIHVKPALMLQLQGTFWAACSLLRILSPPLSCVAQLFKR